MVQTTPEAWVTIPSESDLRPLMPAGAKHPYDFGFLPGMMRLIIAHGRIGRAFGACFSEIMFSPEGRLNRREREMIAAVTAAAQDCHY